MRIHVIGVGTGHGDDAAGLAVAAALAAHPLPPEVAVWTCERPVPDLVEAVAGADAVVLVDAARSGAAPGRVARLGRDAIACLRGASSHGLGVGEALELADALGAPPRRVEVVAIEIAAPERPTPAAATLSPAVRAAIPEAARLVLEIMREIGGFAPLPSPAA